MAKNASPSLLLWLGIALVILLADQLTKLLIVDSFLLGDSQPVTTFFILWLLRSHPTQKLFCFALALVLGGAVGNVIDRIAYGHVVDFLDFHWDWLSPVFFQGHFPAFNVADSAISVGAVCLILDELIRVRKS